MGPRRQDRRASAPEPPAKRRGDVVRQRHILAATGSAGLLGPRTLPAAGLAKRPDEHCRPARPAAVEVSGPVVGRLAVGTHEHPLVADHAPLPRAPALARIGLSRAAAVARHSTARL